MKAVIWKTSNQNEERIEINTPADLQAIHDKHKDCKGLIINFYDETVGNRTETIMLIEVYDAWRE